MTLLHSNLSQRGRAQYGKYGYDFRYAFSLTEKRRLFLWKKLRKTPIFKEKKKSQKKSRNIYAPTQYWKSIWKTKSYFHKYYLRKFNFKLVYYRKYFFLSKVQSCWVLRENQWACSMLNKNKNTTLYINILGWAKKHEYFFFSFPKLKKKYSCFLTLPWVGA